MEQTLTSEPFLEKSPSQDDSSQHEHHDVPGKPVPRNDDEEQSVLHVAELQMMATQAQSTANFTMKSMQELETKKQTTVGGTTTQTFKKDGSLERPDQSRDAFNQSLDSIHVGQEGIEQPQMREKGKHVSMGETVVGRANNSTVRQEEGAETTQRFLNPKYSACKNNSQIRKTHDSRTRIEDGSAYHQEQDRLASTQLQNLDRSARAMGLLDENGFDADGYKNQQQTNKIMNPYAKQKKNSVDQIDLKQVSQLESNSWENQESLAIRGQQAQSGTTSRKSFADAKSETQSNLLLQKRSKIEARNRQQQPLRQQFFDALVTSNATQKLPTLPRNESQLDESRNSTFSLAKQSSSYMAMAPHDLDAQVMLKQSKANQRGSLSQLKQAKATLGSLVQTNSLVDVKQKHQLQFPDVQLNQGPPSQKIGNGTVYLNNRDRSEEDMLINDYNQPQRIGIHHQQQQQQHQSQQQLSQSQFSSTPGFNKIQFKSSESRMTAPRLNEKLIQSSTASLIKKKMRESHNSAIRIVKRQQNKFSIMDGVDSPPSYASKYDSLLADPGKVYHTQTQEPNYTRRIPPHSAIMQQLLASSKKNLHSSSHFSSTEKLLHPHEISTSTSVMKESSIFKPDQGVQKRIRAAQEQIALAEIAVTNAQNANNLSEVQVDQMLQTYVQSLQKTVTLANPKHTALTSELQQFVQSCTKGVQHTAQLRQKLIDEQLERFEKRKDEFKQHIARQDAKMAEMQIELDSRPFQKHFITEEELEKQIEDQRKHAEEKQRMSDEIESQQYSGAQTELQQLSEVFAVINNMNISQLQCSYVDKALFTEKHTTVGSIGKEIKDEGNEAIRATAKRVLDQFWRYYTTADGSTQTEEKVIDSLKATIIEQKEEIKNKKRIIDEVENQKIDLEAELNQSKAMHSITKDQSKAKDVELEDLQASNQKMIQEVQDLKNKHKQTVDRFKSFTEEITGLKMTNQSVSEQLRTTQAALAAKDAVIRQLRQSTASLGITVARIEKEEADDKVQSDGSDAEPAENKKGMKKSASKSKMAAKGKKGKKGAGMKKNASKASINSPKVGANKNRTLQDQADTQTEEQLKMRLSEVMRAELIEEAEKKIKDQLKAARDAADAAEQSKASIQRRKDKKIKELEDAIEEKVQQIKNLKNQLSSRDSMPSTQGRADTNDAAYTSRLQNDYETLNPTLSNDRIESVKPQSSGKAAKPNESGAKPRTIVKPQDRKGKGGRVRDSLQDGSNMNSSQFSIRMMNPTLDKSGTLSSQPETASEQVKTIESEKHQTASQEFQLGDDAKANNSLESVVEGSHGKTAGHVTVSASRKALHQPKQQSRIKDMSKSPQIGHHGNSVNLADQHPNNTTKPVAKRLESQAKNRNGKNALMQTGPSGGGNARKISQGSQVDKLLLHPDSTDYNDEAMQDILQGRSEQQSRELSNEMSVQMLEKYEGRQDLYSPSIVNIPINQQGIRNYGNVINSFEDQEDATNQDLALKRNTDCMSDQTLHIQPQSSQSPARDSVVKMMRKQDLSQLNRPKVDLPANLSIESKQYKIRQLKDSVLQDSDVQKARQHERTLSTTRLDSRAINEGNKMLQEHLGFSIPNRKLEKFSSLIQKAYGPTSSVSAKYLLDQAKEHLESQELKILMLMLQMRGQFDRTGGPMVSKQSQTEIVMVSTSQSQRKLKGSSNRDTRSMPALPNQHRSSKADFTEASYRQQNSSRKLHQTELIDEQAEYDRAQVGPVTVSSQRQNYNPLAKAYQRPTMSEIGVQAGDELIKVTMDRMRLMEKNKRMFYGGDDSRARAPQNNLSGDLFTNVDGSFSPAPHQTSNLVKIRQDMLRDDHGKNDRVMRPSNRQQRTSNDYFAEKLRLQMEVKKYQLNELSDREATERLDGQRMIDQNSDRFQAISVDLQNVLDNSYNSHENSQIITRTTPSKFNLNTMGIDTVTNKQKQVQLPADNESFGAKVYNN